MKYLENASAFAGLGDAGMTESMDKPWLSGGSGVSAQPFYASPNYRWGVAASSTAIGALLYTQTSWKKWGMFFGITGVLGLVGAMLSGSGRLGFVPSTNWRGQAILRYGVLR